ncbi:MAG: hypothetical protein ACI94Y_001502 [Maribacter sp.]|jgi:hypothetical protein
MDFFHSKWFGYIKNLFIGVGASVVLLGALEKIEHTQFIPGVSLIYWGLIVEAIMFLLLGLIPPHKEYYWEKLYPGLDSISSDVTPITADPMNSVPALPGLDGEKMDEKLSGMLVELQSMSGSLGSLKALQEVDFSGTSEQIKKMGDFYTNINEAMANMNDSLEDTKRYKEQLAALNGNLGSLNSVYGSMLNAMSNIGK